MGFDVVDISYDPSGAQKLLQFSAQDRVMTVTYNNNTQVPVTGVDLVLETYLIQDDTPTVGHPAALFGGGFLTVSEAGQVLIRAAVKQLFVEQSTYLPNKLLTIMGEYELISDVNHPQYGAWNGLLPNDGNIFVLGWEVHDVINDFNTAFTAEEDMQLVVVPEPATMSMVGLGALALLRRKRK